MHAPSSRTPSPFPRLRPASPNFAGPFSALSTAPMLGAVVGNMPQQGVPCVQPCFHGRARSSSPWRVGPAALQMPQQGRMTHPIPQRSLSVPAFHPFAETHLPKMQLPRLVGQAVPGVLSPPFGSSLLPPATRAQARQPALSPDTEQINRALLKLEGALSGVEHVVTRTVDILSPTFAPTPSIPCSSPEGDISSIDSSLVSPSPAPELLVAADELAWVDSQIDNAVKNRVLCERTRDRLAEMRAFADEAFENIDQSAHNLMSVRQRFQMTELERLLDETRDGHKGIEEKLASEQQYTTSLIDQAQALQGELLELRESNAALLREKGSLQTQNRQLEERLGTTEFSAEQLKHRCNGAEKLASELQELAANSQAGMVFCEERASRLEADVAALAERGQEFEREKLFAGQHIRRIAELDREVASLVFERGSLLELQKAYRERIEQLEKKAASGIYVQDLSSRPVLEEDRGLQMQALQNELQAMRETSVALRSELVEACASREPRWPVVASASSTAETERKQIVATRIADIQDGVQRALCTKAESPREDLGSMPSRTVVNTTEIQDGGIDVKVSFSTPKKLTPRKTKYLIRNGKSTCIDVSAIPEQHMESLERLEKTGWQSIEWKRGYTLLHWAASRGFVELCRYLIELKGDPRQLDDQIRTPIDLAHRNHHLHLATVLQQCTS